MVVVYDMKSFVRRAAARVTGKGAQGRAGKGGGECEQGRDRGDRGDAHAVAAASSLVACNRMSSNVSQVSLGFRVQDWSGGSSATKKGSAGQGWKGNGHTGRRA